MSHYDTVFNIGSMVYILAYRFWIHCVHCTLLTSFTCTCISMISHNYSNVCCVLPSLAPSPSYLSSLPLPCSFTLLPLFPPPPLLLHPPTSLPSPSLAPSPSYLSSLPLPCSFTLLPPFPLPPLLLHPPTSLPSPSLAPSPSYLPSLHIPCSFTLLPSLPLPSLTPPTMNLFPSPLHLISATQCSSGLRAGGQTRSEDRGNRPINKVPVVQKWPPALWKDGQAACHCVRRRQ